MRSPAAARLNTTVPRRTAVAAAIAWTLLTLPPAHALPAPDVTAVEFYQSSADIYRLTANPTEIASLDAPGSGWIRTGGQFSGWSTAADPNAVAVCSRSQPAGSGTALFSVNTADCTAPGGGWTSNGTAFYALRSSGNSCPAGSEPVYAAFAGDAGGRALSYRYVADPTASYTTTIRGYADGGIAFCAPLSDAQVEADVIRFLEQASFGPTDALIATVKQKGIPAWIDEQFATPASRFKDYAFQPVMRPDTCKNDLTLPTTPTSMCERDNYSIFPLQIEFFTQAMTGHDQLRQRVAFALSQILVTSSAPGDGLRIPYSMAPYQQMLRDNAFGSFENLLTQVTLSPVMGDYLDMANNNKGNGVINPNENYAREILQLFSIGTVRLNLDGTPVVNSEGEAVPTYGQNEILNYARVFTGWTYPTFPGATPRPNNPPYYAGQLFSVANNHDTGSKTLLDGLVAPAMMSAEQDLTFAIRSIASHANVAPFISKQLIQRLVTSNPSPRYVARVATVFNNNGAGARGDLKAVVKAILLDPEARGSRKVDPEYGRLREPVLLATNALRALNASTDGFHMRDYTARLGQEVYRSPSVFNFYPPEHSLPGLPTLAPEFAILTTTSTIARINYINEITFSTIGAHPYLYGAIGTTPNWSGLQAVAGDPAALVAKLDRLLLHGTMSKAMKNSVIAAVNAVSATDTLTRAKTAAYLVLSASQYQIAR